MRNALLSTSVLALIAPLPAYAAAAPQASGQNAAEDIVVTGTRQVGTHAADSAAPIQVVGAQAIQNAGPVDLGPALSKSLPSLNFQGFGYDTANLTLSAALRGISPNDTLVLINGKRRHTTANLAVVFGSPYSGAATTDLSFVPMSAVQRVEVLQDGAAAQYGSDAVAGVINIITKTANSGGSAMISGGSNYENGGATVSASMNAGFKLTDRGYINITGEYKYHDFTQQGGCDRRYFDSSCNITSTDPIVVAGLKANSDYPRVNRIIGDSSYTVYNAFVDAGYDLSDAAQLYAFGSYGNRTARSAQNYRAATRISGTTSDGTVVYPLASGFTPYESIHEEDFSATVGTKGVVSDWNYDLSGTYGRDAVALYTLNSAQSYLYSELQSQSATALTGLQRNFYDGQLTNSEWAGNFDLTHDFDVGLAKPVTLALGSEVRRDGYGIAAGEWAAYSNGGAQGYQGLAPTDAGNYHRTSYAFYADVAADPIESLHTDFAGRYEHYSDFGSVWTGKATARYDFSNAFAIRGTVSNGFRAPTLAEEYYSSVNTGPGYVYGQLPANSEAAQVLGFSKLKPEHSTSLSLGIVAHPLPGVQVTVDAYQIKIRDRIVASGNLYGSVGSTVTSQAVLDALSARNISLTDATSYSGINIFTNGADTRTRGVEATASYASDFGDLGHVDWSLGANYNKTVITNLVDLPDAVYNASIGQTKLMTQYSIDGLTTAAPRVKIIANATWNRGPISVNLRETMYGHTSQHLSPDGSGQGEYAELIKIGTTVITDLDVGYKITPSLKLSIGANNLFDKKATTIPTVTINGVVRPLMNNIYNAPLTFTPWGINGGYYYAKIAFNF